MNRIKKIVKCIIPEKLLVYRRQLLLDKQRKRFHKGCRKLLYKVDNILNENNIPYWLTYGTLLGAYREHDFIAHDYDIDIAIDIKYKDLIKSLMIENGLKLKVEVHFGSWDNPDNLEFRFEYEEAFVDIDFYVINDANAYTYNPLFIKGIEYRPGEILPVIVERIDNPFEGLTEIDFLGKKINVPKNTEEFIIANYGPNWNKPIKDYDYHDCASNITPLSQDVFPGYVKIY